MSDIRPININEKISYITSDKKYIDGFIEKCKEWDSLAHCLVEYISQTNCEYNNKFGIVRGMSQCIMCNNIDGTYVYRYNGFIFDADIFHYIIYHHIDIPIEFQHTIVENDVLTIEDIIDHK